jgi:lipoprotein-releasing system permease protein
MASSKNLSTGALVRGIRPDDFRATELLANSIDTGSLDDFNGRNTIVIGYRMASALRVRPGDLVTLISPQGTVTAFGAVPRMAAYRVAATFNVGMHEYDSSFVFMPLQAAQVFFRYKGAVTGLDVMIDDPDRAAERGTAILRLAIPGLSVVTWTQKNASYFNALKVERNVMFLILTLIIIVAAFNIISSMIMLVKDKGRDIAILRTMGATRGMVMRIFFMSGAAVGVVGTFMGLALGWLIARFLADIQERIEELIDIKLFPPEIYFLTQIPSVMDPVEVAQVVGLGLALSFLATLYPSWRAARLDPVEALRYE